MKKIIQFLEDFRQIMHDVAAWITISPLVLAIINTEQIDHFSMFFA